MLCFWLTHSHVWNTLTHAKPYAFGWVYASQKYSVDVLAGMRVWVYMVHIRLSYALVCAFLASTHSRSNGVEPTHDAIHIAYTVDPGICACVSSFSAKTYRYCIHTVYSAEPALCLSTTRDWKHLYEAYVTSITMSHVVQSHTQITFSHKILCWY